jgi:hypothetical protein
MRFTLVIFNTYSFLLFFAKCLVSLLLAFKALFIISSRFFTLTLSAKRLLVSTFIITHTTLYFKVMSLVERQLSCTTIAKDIYG